MTIKTREERSAKAWQAMYNDTKRKLEDIRTENEEIYSTLLQVESDFEDLEEKYHHRGEVITSLKAQVLTLIEERDELRAKMDVIADMIKEAF